MAQLCQTSIKYAMCPQKEGRGIKRGGKKPRPTKGNVHRVGARWLFEIVTPTSAPYNHPIFGNSEIPTILWCGEPGLNLYQAGLSLKGKQKTEKAGGHPRFGTSSEM